MCTLNGVYATSQNRFQIQCTTAAIANNNCPVILNPNASVSLNIASSSFCAQVVQNVGVTLLLQPYSDSAFNNLNPTFLVQPNGYMYFLISVSSSPQVTVSALTVDQVVINSPDLPNGQLVLYDTVNFVPGGVTSVGTNFNYGVSSFTFPSGSVYAGFSIGEVSNWNVALDNLDTVTVTAQVTVSYQGLGKKRSVVQASSATQVNAMSTINLKGSPSNSLVSSVIMCMFFICARFLML